MRHNSGKRLSIAVIIVGLWAIAVAWQSSASLLAAEPLNPKRVVCLGDSITEGHTYPYLIQEALRAAGKPVPVFLNAGIGGDTAKGMLARLDADVIDRRPDLVMLSVGINDLGGGVPVPDFIERVSQIIDRLHERKIEVLMLTTTGVRFPESQKMLDERNDALRKLAEQKHVRVADVAAAFAPQMKAGDNLWEPDGCHLNFAGYRCMVRGVLDGLGDSDVAVPETLKPAVLPGAILKWRVRKAPDDQDLDEAKAAAIKPDETWQEYNLPETEPADSWWFREQQQRGIATMLGKRLPGSDHLQAIAVIDSPSERDTYIRAGGEMRRAWLNGKQVTSIIGWRPREYRVHLQKGPNTFVVETSGKFFLSINDDPE